MPVGQRKLGKRTDLRTALLRSGVTAFIEHGRLELTEGIAKEIQKIAEKYIALAAKECDNFTVGKKKVSRAKLDAKGNRITSKKTSKNDKEYTVIEREVTEEEVRLDGPSRLHARRQILSYLYNPKDENGNSKKIINKLFDEIGPKYKERKGGYTRIIKIGPRRGDATEMVILELV